MEPIDVSIQELNDKMYHLQQQHYLLMVYQPGSSLVAGAAQAVEGLQKSIAAVAADAQKLLQETQRDEETQKKRATSMLADLTELPASVLQQLNGEWQDSLKSLAAYLKQHKLQQQFMPLLQCTDGKQLMEMISAVDRFIYDTVLQCHAGPAAADRVWQSTAGHICAAVHDAAGS
jgi:uncharacterized protein YoxC